MSAWVCRCKAGATTNYPIYAPSLPLHSLARIIQSWWFQTQWLAFLGFRYFVPTGNGYQSYTQVFSYLYMHDLYAYFSYNTVSHRLFNSLLCTVLWYLRWRRFKSHYTTL